MLEKTRGNMKEAAQALGIVTCSLGNRIEKIQRKTTLDPMVASDRRRLLEEIEKQKEAARTTATKKPFKKCDRPCKYHAPEMAVNGCDYIQITGHSRGCPAGEECTRFEEGERKQFVKDDWSAPEERVEADLYKQDQMRKHRQFLAKSQK